MTWFEVNYHYPSPERAYDPGPFNLIRQAADPEQAKTNAQRELDKNAPGAVAGATITLY